MRPWLAIAFLISTVTGACSVANPNHCANLEGNATCAARGGQTPYCSKCVADNDGCVAAPADELCDAGEAGDLTSIGETSAPGTTSTPTTGAPDVTTTAATTTTGSSEAQTSTTTGDSSSDDDSTTSGSSSTTTEATSSTSDDSTSSTGDDSTTAPPVCGDGVQEHPEVCDGADLGQFDSCIAKNQEKYGGGTLACDPGCGAYDEADCCLAAGQGCLLNGQKCCPGTSCQLGGMGLFSCKPT